MNRLTLGMIVSVLFLGLLFYAIPDIAAWINGLPPVMP